MQREATPILAATKVISEYLQMPVTLLSEISNTYKDWAFLSGIPLTSEGEAIDYSRTSLAEDFVEGFVDDNFAALVRYSPDDGAGWHVVEFSVGATDAPFISWLEQYDLPFELIQSVAKER